MKRNLFVVFVILLGTLFLCQSVCAQEQHFTATYNHGKKICAMYVTPEIKVPVDYHREYVFVSWSKSVASKFQAPPDIREVKMVLVSFDNPGKAKQIIELMQKSGLRPARLNELMAMREQAFTSDTIVGLGFCAHRRHRLTDPIHWLDYSCSASPAVFGTPDGLMPSSHLLEFIGGGSRLTGGKLFFAAVKE